MKGRIRANPNARSGTSSHGRQSEGTPKSSTVTRTKHQPIDKSHNPVLFLFFPAKLLFPREEITYPNYPNQSKNRPLVSFISAVSDF
jgi:hypothetical protein